MPGTARNRRRTRAGLTLTLMLMACGCQGAALSGCAVGLTPDGRPVFGPVVGPAGQLAEPDVVLDGIETAAGFLPPPWGAIVGSLGVGAAGLLFGRERGRHTGWEERENASMPKPASAPLPGGGQASG